MPRSKKLEARRSSLLLSDLSSLETRLIQMNSWRLPLRNEAIKQYVLSYPSFASSQFTLLLFSVNLCVLNFLNCSTTSMCLRLRTRSQDRTIWPKQRRKEARLSSLSSAPTINSGHRLKRLWKPYSIPSKSKLLMPIQNHTLFWVKLS